MEYLTPERLEELSRSERPLLVECFDPDSGACRLFAPGFAALADQLLGRAIAVRCDIKAQPVLAKQLDVTDVPAVLLLHNGREQVRIVGSHSAQVLRNRLRYWL